MTATSKLKAHDDGRQSVQDVVPSRDLHPQRSQALPFNGNIKGSPFGVHLHVRRAHLRGRFDPVGDDPARQARELVADVQIIQAGDYATVKRHAPGILNKSIADPVETAPIIQMVVINIGNNGPFRRVLEKGTIAFICFNYQQI